MMRGAGNHILRILGGLCATAGFLAWIGLIWRAVSDLEGVTPQSDGGAQLMTWALTGTVLMIVGMVLLHLTQRATEREEPEERTPR